MTSTQHAVEEDQAGVWNGRAGHAWVQAQTLLDDLFRPFEDLLREAVAASPDRPVLDVGCGTGSTTRAAAGATSPMVPVTGIDLSVPMIEAARALSASLGERVRFVCADAERYVFVPKSFGTVISRFGIMFFADPVRAFTNLRAAAQEDARLRAVVWRSAEQNPFMTTAERAAAPLLPELPPRRPDAPGQFAFADADRVRYILGASGWGDVVIRPIDVPCTMPERDLAEYVTRLGPLGRILPDVDAPRCAEIVRRVRAAFDPYLHGEAVRFDAACWLLEARATHAAGSMAPIG
ncbi:class I SAM-dependent methyltransferase [Methylobacterium organophilum]|uniref:class I SAM-dependent methyltransferase n=1 Tax=Methylobacterium organophilum TaxID=410 RepID=UPI001F13328F|nr:class I SAM-dependent methyltransferase [Methylobacterium organophilum]UMY17391.1 class I SAM-dependent methyltransferase [Methylobacterium organophilum]